MTDHLSPDQRRRLMQRVKSKDTSPEIAVRRAFHAAGLRFRLQRRDLPGTPDLVLPRYKLAVFVHGCFWHRHAGCRRANLPNTNREYWVAKLEGNARRDQAAESLLNELGWTVHTIWGCEATTGAVTDFAHRLKGTDRGTPLTGSGEDGSTADLSRQRNRWSGEFYVDPVVCSILGGERPDEALTTDSR